MKVFISADIEGTAFTTYWEETEKDKGTYARAAEEMTREVCAAIEGALAAGADEILVNDAHDFGINLDPFRMPENVELIRGWSGSPMGMAEGIDESFDAAFFVGWHSPAGMCNNPLSRAADRRPAAGGAFPAPPSWFGDGGGQGRAGRPHPLQIPRVGGKDHSKGRRTGPPPGFKQGQNRAAPALRL